EPGAARACPERSRMGGTSNSRERSEENAQTRYCRAFLGNASTASDTDALLDVELAHFLLGADDFHLVPQLVGESDFLRNAIHQNNGRRKIGSVHLDVFQPDNAIDERLQNLDVFYPIQLQRLGDFAEN